MTAPSSRTLTAEPCWKALRPKSSRMNSSAPEMIPVSKPNRKLPMVMAIAHLRTVLSPFGVSSTKWLSAEGLVSNGPFMPSCPPSSSGRKFRHRTRREGHGRHAMPPPRVR